MNINYNLTNEDIAEFKAIMKKETDKNLTDDEAHEQATNLLSLVEVVLKK